MMIQLHVIAQPAMDYILYWLWIQILQNWIQVAVILALCHLIDIKPRGSLLSMLRNIVDSKTLKCPVQESSSPRSTAVSVEETWQHAEVSENKTPIIREHGGPNAVRAEGKETRVEDAKNLKTRPEGIKREETTSAEHSGNVAISTFPPKSPSSTRSKRRRRRRKKQSLTDDSFVSQVHETSHTKITDRLRALSAVKFGNRFIFLFIIISMVFVFDNANCSPTPSVKSVNQKYEFCNSSVNLENRHMIVIMHMKTVCSSEQTIFKCQLKGFTAYLHNESCVYMQTPDWVIKTYHLEYGNRGELIKSTPVDQFNENASVIPGTNKMTDLALSNQTVSRNQTETSRHSLPQLAIRLVIILVALILSAAVCCCLWVEYNQVTRSDDLNGQHSVEGEAQSPASDERLTNNTGQNGIGGIECDSV
ncbi:uncharacterized protein LOC134577161 [Pelobates fuscus]|uniref:uncharacterized protein LOC134577161 n=1 Tax=Pelobates fuscus TaxID=191477 RepID=UPI002FE44CA2